MLRALFPKAVFTPIKRSVHSLVKFHSQSLHSEVDALVDSGATDNFVSPDLVDHFRIPTYPLDEPRGVRNVDGSPNDIGGITHAATLDITHNGKKNRHTFYIISLGDDHMLLGMPFLAAANPKINWATATLHGQVTAATVNAHRWNPTQNCKVQKPFSMTRRAHFYKPRDTPPSDGE